MRRIQNCFYPKVVHNVYLGQDVTCRCGKCNACLNERAAKWVQRLDMESQCHKYTLFVTLTYNDYDVPQIVRLRKDDYPNAAYIDSETGVLYDCREIKKQFTSKDWQYIADSKVLDVLNKQDFQKFIKRLRYYFNQLDNAKLRYFLAAEYGPRTYRPHGHMLLFFDSEKCLSEIEVLLSKSWTHGNIYDPHLVTGSAADYCASYVNSLSSLPAVYAHRWLRPFTLFSKSPSIGSLLPCFSKVRQLVTDGVTSVKVYNQRNNRFDDVPLWRSFEGRLYPRLARFGSLTHDERESLYRFGAESAETDSAVSFARKIQKTFIDTPRPDTFLGRYFREISKKYTYKFHFVSDFSGAKLDYSTLPFPPSDDYLIPIYKNGLLKGYKCLSSEFCFDSLVRCCRTLLRFAHQAQIFGFSVNEYLCYIEKYYDKKSYLRLVEDYEFQSDYFRTHPAWHFIYFDKSFYDKVINTDYRMLTNQTRFMLQEMFNYDVPLKSVRVSPTEDSIFLDIPSLEDLEDFKDMVFLHSKIAHDLVKQKANNDYVLLHKDKFGNIIKYQNL